MYLFIDDATTYDVVETEEDFYQSAKAFGHFQRLLEKYPVENLTETIPDFHNTPKRFETFKKVLEADVCGRAKDVQAEIDFVMAHEADMSVVMDKLKGKCRTVLPTMIQSSTTSLTTRQDRLCA